MDRKSILKSIFGESERIWLQKKKRLEAELKEKGLPPTRRVEVEANLYFVNSVLKEFQKEMKKYVVVNYFKDKSSVEFLVPDKEVVMSVEEFEKIVKSAKPREVWQVIYIGSKKECEERLAKQKEEEQREQELRLKYSPWEVRFVNKDQVKKGNIFVEIGYHRMYANKVLKPVVDIRKKGLGYFIHYADGDRVEVLPSFPKSIVYIKEEC